MHQQIEKLKAAIAPVRGEIVDHPLYHSIRTLEDVQTFASHHVFAVWDFMSLLKGLQRQLTCVEFPWLPVGDANARYLINEIVTGEESDVDERGQRCSHFELYCRAMEQCGADTSVIDGLLTDLRSGLSLQAALNAPGIPEAVRRFVSFTFDILRQGDPAVLASVFSFGREDLIPDMFYGLVKDLDQRFPGQLSVFRYYLERHIEVDGDHHSHLAMEMVAGLCGNDPAIWQRATDAALEALKMRKLLWDEAHAAILRTEALEINK
ncbi:MAG: DUF3050 domain-containing protein [Bacteroidetes bacterium]|nr:DUF3050 domain-containing protein [Bacteroidota bacterium]